MFGAGSGHDHKQLRDALERHDRAERLVAFLQHRPRGGLGLEPALAVEWCAVQAERDAYRALMASAALCGWTMQAETTAKDFAARRVASFDAHFRGV